MTRIKPAQLLPLHIGARLAIGLALVCLTSLPCAATVLNGSFDSGLTDWTTQGNVSGTTDASLADGSDIYSLLYQGVPLAPGTYRLEFEFLNLLSVDLSNDPFAFPDAFFASLFFIDDIGSFDLAGLVFDDATALMDMDAIGPYNVLGTLSPSAIGPEWTHYTYDFTNAYGYVVPVFELLDFNTIAGDSTVRLDNVSITPFGGVVPEPATITLSLMGFLGFAISRGRKGAAS